MMYMTWCLIAKFVIHNINLARGWSFYGKHQNGGKVLPVRHLPIGSPCGGHTWYIFVKLAPKLFMIWYHGCWQADNFNYPSHINSILVQLTFFDISNGDIYGSNLLRTLNYWIIRKNDCGTNIISSNLILNNHWIQRSSVIPILMRL